MANPKGRPSSSELIDKLRVEIKKDIDRIENISFLLCPDCGKDQKNVKMNWINADQLSFGDYVDVRAELNCPDCNSHWQFKLPQLQRSQPQNRLSAVMVDF